MLEKPTKSHHAVRHLQIRLIELPSYLQHLGLQPRKALGQHFLIDELALGKIAEAGASSDIDTVLEIGAGPGGLTEELLTVFRNVVAIDLDEELAVLTRKRLRDVAGSRGATLNVIAADILEFQPHELLMEAGLFGPYVVVGNLPFYITQPIVRHLLEANPSPVRIVVMVQREVARRIVGGHDRESLLSISVKFYGKAEILFDVPASSFWPEPKVNSAVVAIDPLDPLPVQIDISERSSFFHLVRTGFATPRKQLRNSLSGGLRLPTEAIVTLLESTSLNPTLRAQHLDLMDWAKLYRAIQSEYPKILTVWR